MTNEEAKKYISQLSHEEKELLNNLLLAIETKNKQVVADNAENEAY